MRKVIEKRKSNTQESKEEIKGIKGKKLSTKIISVLYSITHLCHENIEHKIDRGIY